MHALGVSKWIQVNKSITFVHVLKKFGTYFKILVYRVRCDVEKITFYFQNLIFMIKNLLFTLTSLKNRKKVKGINIKE